MTEPTPERGRARPPLSDRDRERIANVLVFTGVALGELRKCSDTAPIGEPLLALTAAYSQLGRLLGEGGDVGA